MLNYLLQENTRMESYKKQNAWNDDVNFLSLIIIKFSLKNN